MMMIYCRAVWKCGFQLASINYTIVHMMLLCSRVGEYHFSISASGNM